MRTDGRQGQLKSIKALGKEGRTQEAFRELTAVMDGGADFASQHRLARLYASLDRSALDLEPLRVALVATSTVEHFADVLGLFLARDGFNAEFFIADFDTLHQTVLDTGSGLHAFRPDIVWLFTNYRDVPFELPPGSSAKAVEEALESAIGSFSVLWETLRENGAAHILQNNADLPLERPFGNLEGGLSWGRLGFLRNFNQELAAAALPGLTVFDMDHLSSAFGKGAWFDERYWYHSKHAFSLDAAGLVARQAARLIKAIKGGAKKCLVLDLDNTL